MLYVQQRWNYPSQSASRKASLRNFSVIYGETASMIMRRRKSVRNDKTKTGKKTACCGINPTPKNCPDFLLCGNNVPLLFKQLSVAIWTLYRQDHPNWQEREGGFRTKYGKHILEVQSVPGQEETSILYCTPQKCYLLWEAQSKVLLLKFQLDTSITLYHTDFICSFWKNWIKTICELKLGSINYTFIYSLRKQPKLFFKTLKCWKGGNSMDLFKFST